MHRYRFESTIEDLLDAEEADATRRSDVRSPLRWAIAALTGAMALAFLSALLAPPHTWQAIIPFSLCCYSVYYFVLAGYIRRRRIRRENAPHLEVTAEFRDDGMEFTVEGRGTHQHDWREMILFADAARGVLLYLDDGTVNWLPNRVFADRAQKKAFVEFLGVQEERLIEKHHADEH